MSPARKPEQPISGTKEKHILVQVRVQGEYIPSLAEFGERIGKSNPQLLLEALGVLQRIDTIAQNPNSPFMQGDCLLLLQTIAPAWFIKKPKDPTSL